MFQLDSYLFFDGTCADAMKMMMTHGQSPTKDQVPEGSEDRILHATLRMGAMRLMASDCLVGQTYEGMKGFCLSLNPLACWSTGSARRGWSQAARLTKNMA